MEQPAASLLVLASLALALSSCRLSAPPVPSASPTPTATTFPSTATPLPMIELTSTAFESGKYFRARISYVAADRGGGVCESR